MQRVMVEVGRLGIRHHTRPQSIPHSGYPGSDSGFDSWKEVAAVDAEVADCEQLVKTSEPPCFPSFCVPSSSPSLTIFSFSLLASWQVCP